MKFLLVLALTTGALAIFLSAGDTGAQTPGSNRLSPPAAPSRPSPSPAPEITTAAKPEPTPPDGGVDDADVIRVTSTLVIVPVSVIDAAGQPVPGLTIPDFHLDEEGKTQTIAQIGNPEQVPLEIALLIDVSSSVSKKFDFELQAATRFLKQVMKPGDRAAVYAIDLEPRLLQPLNTAEAASAELLRLRAPVTPVPTPYYDAVRMAARYLAENTPGNHHRVVVVISDGDDNFSSDIKDTEIAVYQNKTGTDNNSKENREARSDFLEKQRQLVHNRAQAEVLREVQRADVTFYSINPAGSTVWMNKPLIRGEKGMELISEGTGGTSFLPNKAEDLDQVFRQITSELRAQYLLEYYSTDETSPEGKFLGIKVEVPQKTAVKVRARSGYYIKRK